MQVYCSNPPILLAGDNGVSLLVLVGAEANLQAELIYNNTLDKALQR